jgi:hypothetical protein
MGTEIGLSNNMFVVAVPTSAFAPEVIMAAPNANSRWEIERWKLLGVESSHSSLALVEVALSRALYIIARLVLKQLSSK